MSIYQEQFLNGKVTVTGASTLVSGADNNIRYIALCNDSADVIYLSIGEAAVAHEGIRLNPNGGCFEINFQNPIKQAIYAISAGTSSVLTYVIIK